MISSTKERDMRHTFRKWSDRSSVIRYLENLEFLSLRAFQRDLVTSEDDREKRRVLSVLSNSLPKVNHGDGPDFDYAQAPDHWRVWSGQILSPPAFYGRFLRSRAGCHHRRRFQSEDDFSKREQSEFFDTDLQPSVTTRTRLTFDVIFRSNWRSGTLPDKKDFGL